MSEPADCRILLVDDEEEIRFTLGHLLMNEGYRVDVAAGHVDAIVSLQGAQYDLAFVDIMLAGDSGIDVLRDIKAISPTTEVIMFTGFPQIESATAAVRLGAFDYIMKPVSRETLLSIARHALSVKGMNDKLERYRANLDAIFRTVSDSIIMVDKEGRLAQFNATAGKICGYSDAVIGTMVTEICLGCSGGCRNALLETLATKTPKELSRFECRTAAGRSRFISFRSNPVIEVDGTFSGAVAIIRDETHLAELELILQNRSQFHGIIGVSVPMQRVYSLIEALANVPSTVLITGESGTGKELVAAALHSSGKRSKGPFVKVNCSALSESLLESELFGHVRGAFTGAIADKVGRFQKAHGGTLFLDEIGDITPAVQMRLLRVLQESEFERVGESTPIKVDVRIVTATNQDLEEKVRLGTFRQDLFYRLNVICLEMPPLRERLDDLSFLVAHFISRFNDKFGRKIRGVSDNVTELFRAHDWPGNIRELEHVIERAVILCKLDIISVTDLPESLRHDPRYIDNVTAETTPAAASPQQPLTLEEAMIMADGNKAGAARLLGISRPTFYKQLKNK